MVEIKGPEATAGSNPNRSIATGIKEPAKFATVIAQNMATPTARPRIILPFHRLTTRKTVRPVTAPVTNPVAISAKIKLKKDRFPSSLSDILRTETARDCVPAFPAVPVIKLIKIARTEALLTKPSKWSIRLAVPIPKNKSATSQGKRFAADWTGF